MRADIPLTEDDWAPWLATLRVLVERLARAVIPGGGGTVLRQTTAILESDVWQRLPYLGILYNDQGGRTQTLGKT